MDNLEKILELLEEDFTEEELKQWSYNASLFIDLYSVYDKMSPRGKKTTVQTLFIELLNEKEGKKC